MGFKRKIRKSVFFIIFVIISIVLLVVWVGYHAVYKTVATNEQSVTFQVSNGESIYALGAQLQNTKIINSAWLFRQVIFFSGTDTRVHSGTFKVNAPVTIARIVYALEQTGEPVEKTITILPGWNLSDIANYFLSQKIGTTSSFFALVGQRAVDPTTSSLSFSPVLRILKNKPVHISYEGYLRPDTYRIYAHASLESVLKKLIESRNTEFTNQMYADMKIKHLTVNDILTMASIVEKETKTPDDMSKVADIFWRRLNAGMPFQSDATVLYSIGKNGNISISDADLATQNVWNTYVYTGLPPGPIDNPSDVAIHAALYPKQNNYWYFISDKKEIMHYSTTLLQHNRNVQEYLR